MVIRAARALDKKSFKRHLNHSSKFKKISQNCSAWYPPPKLHKWFALLKKRTTRTLDKNYLQMTSLEPLVQIQNNFTELFLMMLSIEIAQMVLLSQTKGPPVLKIGNIFKRLLLNHWSKIQIISQNCSWWCSLPEMQKLFRFTEQNECHSSR